jgi:hypothetical protein
LKVGVNQQPLVHPPVEACFNPVVTEFQPS